MPTYVYACDSCGAQFERFQSFKDDPLRTCPSCAGDVRRVFQPVGIVFKGSGWYINDSRKATSSSVGGESKTETKAETASETKSEAKAETTSSETKAETKPEAKKEAAA